MKFDVIIIGAGAAGLYCAQEAGKRGLKVALLEHTDKIGQKILVSGGGRCNFSNTHVSPENYISHNVDYVKSALASFNAGDLYSILKKNNISFYEKEKGQLFCRQPAKAFLGALRKECEKNGAIIKKGVRILDIKKEGYLFMVSFPQKREYRVYERGPRLRGEDGIFTSASLVIATGGLSYKKLGATDLGHKIARQFGHKVTDVRPGLVPLVFGDKEGERFKDLAGVSFDAKVSCGSKSFDGGVIFTHNGFSGPAILQISSYWKLGQKISMCCSNIPARLNKRLKRSSYFEFIPAGTAGFEKAEVTVGGVSTEDISSKTMGSKKVKGLFFIGEVLDVTGELGGYNLHWAWASAHAASMGSYLNHAG